MIWFLYQQGGQLEDLISVRYGVVWLSLLNESRC